jgi:hypothetical protein
VNPPEPKVEARRRRHREILVVCTIVVGLSLALQVRPDDRVELRFLPGLPIPQSCASRSLTEIPCPACGLTRSFVHLAHGDWRSALAVHRIGWVMAAAVLFQFPYRLAALRRPDARLLGERFLSLAGMSLIALLIANWLLQRLGV